MTRARVEEMAKRIADMHGFAERENQRFFFDGKIFYYNMECLDTGFYRIYVRTAKNMLNLMYVRQADNGDYKITVIGYKFFNEKKFIEPVKRNF